MYIAILKYIIQSAQGLILDKTVVDLGSSIFVHRQAYVALSRTRNLDSLFLSDFKIESIKTNPQVIQFYTQLQEKIENETIEMSTILHSRNKRQKYM